MEVQIEYHPLLLLKDVKNILFNTESIKLLYLF